MENRLRSKEAPEHEGSGVSLIYAREVLSALFVGGLSGSLAMRNSNVGMPAWMSIIPGAICLFHLSNAAFFFSSLIHSLAHYEGIEKSQKSFFEKSYPYLAESILWGAVTFGIFSHNTSEIKYLTGLTALLTTIFGLLAGVRATFKIEPSSK